MEIEDLINWSKLSELLTGNPDAIRRNRIPKKYREIVRIYINALKVADGIKKGNHVKKT